VVVSGVLFLGCGLLAGAAVTYLLRRWRLATGLGAAMLLLALARGVVAAPRAASRLLEILLWPGVASWGGVLVQMDAPLILAGRTWMLEPGDVPWMAFLLIVGALAVLLGLATSARNFFPSLGLVALAGGLVVITAHPPTLGLLGGGVVLCCLALILKGDGRGPSLPGVLLLAGGVLGLVALLLGLLMLAEPRPEALAGSLPPLALPAIALGLACWLGCPPWGPWVGAACRQSHPVATGFSLMVLPTLTLSVLRTEGLEGLEPALLWGGGWFLAVGAAGALAHRDLRRVWYDLALCNLGLVLWGAWQFGAGWEGVGSLLVLRGVALAGVALGLAWLPEETLAGAAHRRPWAAAATLVGLAALLGLPLSPAYGAWHAVLWGALGEAAAVPGWGMALAVLTLAAGSLGWWRVLRLLVKSPGAPALVRQSHWQAVIGAVMVVIMLGWRG